MNHVHIVFLEMMTKTYNSEAAIFDHFVMTNRIVNTVWFDGEEQFTDAQDHRSRK